MAIKLDELTADDAWDLLQRFTIRPTRPSTTRRTTMRRGDMEGRYLVIFRDHGVPFYMTPFGTQTEKWRESKSFRTVGEARDLIIDLIHARPLSTYDFKKSRGRRSDEDWDRIFLINADSARIYLVEKESPERWWINEDIPILTGGTYDEGTESADHETDFNSASEETSECVPGPVSA